MESYDDLKAHMETIQRHIKVKRLCKELGFTSRILKCSIAEGRKKK